MRKNIAKVIRAFLDKKEASGDSKRTCWTDGDAIYSYRLPIAWYVNGRTDQGTSIMTSTGEHQIVPCKEHEDCRANPEMGRVCVAKALGLVRASIYVRPEGGLTRTTTSQVRAIALALKHPNLLP